MKWRGYAVILYGILLLAGGIIGHIKANSQASLLMGGGSAIITLACGWAMLKESVIGLKAAIASSAILFLFFSYRLILTGKMMPAGMMAIVSLIILSILSFGLKSPLSASEK